MLLCPPFGRWLAWELAAKSVCDMQYYFVLVHNVFLPFQYQGNFTPLVKDFFLELLHKELNSIHFEIIVLFQYLAQQCEEMFWLFDILVNLNEKNCAFKIISYIPFQQLIPAIEIR
jgi:hypothetical protein